MTKNEFGHVLIIGMAGGLARIAAGLLSRKWPETKITGIDSRPMEDHALGDKVEFKRMRYTRTNFEKLFRNNKFDVVLHLGRVSHASINPRSRVAHRIDLNVMGTNRILELGLKFGVKKTIVLSTWHVYGAYADNPAFIKEETLLRAAIKYPELRDVVEMDQIVTTWMWKHQHESETVLLRPCSIIGPQINNSMTKYLTTPYAPLAMDFNPMMQFIHEFDMANILTHCIDRVPTGVYNISTDESVSIHDAKKIVGVSSVPVPIFLLEQAAKIINSSLLWSVPNYLLDYLKYPTLLSNSEIKRHLPSDCFRFGIRESLELLTLD